MTKEISYTLKRNVRIFGQGTNEKEDREIFEEINRKSLEKYGEKGHDTVMYGMNKNGTGSQFFFNNEVNLYLPYNGWVMTLEDLKEIYNADPNFFSMHYGDTTDLVLRSFTPTWPKNKQVLGYLERQLKRQLKGERIHGALIEFDSENPIRLSGLENIKDSNDNNFYGIKSKIGNDTKIVYAPEFASSKDKIKFGNVEKNSLTKFGGLSGVCAVGVSYVDSDNVSLRISSDNGWAVVVTPEKD